MALEHLVVSLFIFTVRASLSLLASLERFHTCNEKSAGPTSRFVPSETALSKGLLSFISSTIQAAHFNLTTCHSRVLNSSRSQQTTFLRARHVLPRILPVYHVLSIHEQWAHLGTSRGGSVRASRALTLRPDWCAAWLPMMAENMAAM